MVSDKDVGSNATVRDYPSYGINLLEIVLTCIFPVHVVKDLIASALCREMNVMTEVRLLSDGVEDILRHILRIGRGEAHPHVGDGPCHSPEQFSEGAYMQFLAVLLLYDNPIFRSCAIRE